MIEPEVLKGVASGGGGAGLVGAIGILAYKMGFLKPSNNGNEREHAAMRLDISELKIHSQYTKEKVDKIDTQVDKIFDKINKVY